VFILVASSLPSEKDTFEGGAAGKHLSSIFNRLVPFGSGATAFVLLEHIRKTCGVVVSAQASFPVAAVASALIVGRLDVTVAGRFEDVGSGDGERCYGLSAATEGARSGSFPRTSH